MKKVLSIIVLAAVWIASNAQNHEGLNSGLEILSQDTATIAETKLFKPVHMVGLRYGYNLCTWSTSQDVGSQMTTAPVNVELMYTYYKDMWNMMNYFGIQAGLRYGTETYESKYMDPEKFQIAQLSLLSQFHIDFSRFRILAQAGPYYSYSLKNFRDDGLWNDMDIRHNYGILAGGGFGVVFEPFELHLEANYKFGLGSIYNVNKISDLYWITVCPRHIMINATLYFHLW